MNLRTSRILGIDAGLRSQAVVVFELRQRQWKPVRSFLHSTDKNESRYVAEDNRRRIEFLSGKLAEIIREEKPDFVVAELPTGGAKSSRAIVAMTLAFSVVVITCQQNGVRLEHVTPTELKQHVAPGQRKVSKEAVIEFVSYLYGVKLLPKNRNKEHVADAMACVSAFLNREA